MKNNSSVQTKNGYIAISSVIVILAVFLIIGTSLSLLAISGAQLALTNHQQQTALNLANACIEDELMTLNKFNTVSASAVLPEGSCQAVVNSQTGNYWTFTVLATVSGYTKQVQVQASRSGTIDVIGINQIN